MAVLASRVATLAEIQAEGLKPRRTRSTALGLRQGRCPGDAGAGRHRERDAVPGRRHAGLHPAADRPHLWPARAGPYPGRQRCEGADRAAIAGATSTISTGWRACPTCPRWNTVLSWAAMCPPGCWRSMPCRRAWLPLVTVTIPMRRPLLLYTSGTTAAPKGVRHSSRSLLAELLAQGLGRTVDDWVLSPWPSGHIAGTLGVLGHALLGRPTILMEAWDAALAARLVEQFKVAPDVGHPVPPVRPARGRGARRARPRQLRAVPDRRHHRAARAGRPCEAAGIRCCRCYGSTELPTATQCVPADPLDKRLGTDGRPNPGVEVRIVDDAGEDLPVGTEGEVAVRGAERFLGYTDPGTQRGQLPAGRLVPHRRHRPTRPGGLSGDHRPQEGHHHPRRREHLLARGGGTAAAGSGRARGRRDRCARCATRRTDLRCRHPGRRRRR
jgi:hypothetical protein